MVYLQLGPVTYEVCGNCEDWCGNGPLNALGSQEHLFMLIAKQFEADGLVCDPHSGGHGAVDEV